MQLEMKENYNQGSNSPNPLLQDQPLCQAEQLVSDTNNAVYQLRQTDNQEKNRLQYLTLL